MAGIECSYELDLNDRIVHVDEGWTEFALANEAPELAAPGPIGRSVFAFIADPTTALLYRHLFEGVRRTGTPIDVPFRCDAPALRRFLTLRIERESSRRLRLASRVVRVEPRPPVILSSAPSDRAAQLLMCSWCKRVKTSEGWVEVEDALSHVRVPAAAGLPGLSYGVCGDCLVLADVTAFSS